MQEEQSPNQAILFSTIVRRNNHSLQPSARSAEAAEGGAGWILWVEELSEEQPWQAAFMRQRSHA